jgi:choline dehydrogenase-like flavoprotein
LIEAGDDQGGVIQQQVPALHLQSTEYETMRWDYFVQHYSDPARQQKDSKMTWQTPSGELHVGANPPNGSEALGILYPRAGTLGGCSTHNAMITVYPFESDWNNIASTTGDSSWQASNMRAYFRRLERNRYLPSSVGGHGFNGWLETSLTSLKLVVEDPKLLSVVLSTATAMGKGLLGALINTVTGLEGILIRDLNSPSSARDFRQGSFQVPIAVADGVRNGPRNFILDTVNAVNSDGSRKYHLDIRTNTFVTKVRFSGSGSNVTAVGVDYLQGQSLYKADPRTTNAPNQGRKGSVNAAKEVILSAGAFNTPQLLKLSGVGPRAELEQFNIPVVVDLPGVGTNLQDRYETTVVGKSNTDFTITKHCTFMMTSPDPCLEQWKNHPLDRGTYATNGISIAAVMKSSVAVSEPDLFISGAPAFFTGYYPGYADYGLKDAKHWAWITLKAQSRNNAGTVKLRSANPLDTPLITFNYFDTGVTSDGAANKDLQAVYEGMQFSRKMFKDLIPLNGDFEEVWPGRNVTSEADLKEFIKSEAWGHHASCTCPIGADNDPMAVLDSNFRVYGVKGLRVVDASVFPKIPGYYIALPVYIISEKAADAILADA